MSMTRTDARPHNDVRLLLDVEARGFTCELLLLFSGIGVLVGGDILPSLHGDERPRPVIFGLNTPLSTVTIGR